MPGLGLPRDFADYVTIKTTQMFEGSPDLFGQRTTEDSFFQQISSGTIAKTDDFDPGTGEELVAIFVKK